MVYIMTRSRTLSDPAVVGRHRNYKNGVQQSNFADTTMSSYSSVMVDTVTPNFRQIIQEGGIVNNPCTMTVTQRTTTGSGSVTQVQIAAPHDVWVASGNGTITGYYQKYGGGLPSYTEAPLPGLTDLGLVAKQKCLAQIDSTPFSFAEDLSEIRETIRFLRDPLASLRTLSTHYRKAIEKIKTSRSVVAALRRNKRYPREVLEDLAGVWLTQRFAVMPIFRTVLGAMEAYETEKVYRPERRVARGFSEAPNKSDARSVVKTASGRTFTYWCSAKSSGSARAGVLYEVSNPVVNFQYKYGLRFKDIPETMWAVSPLSFMVDRFYNISDFFGGAVNLLDPNVKVLAAWIVTKRERTSSIGVRKIVESGYTSTISPDDIVDREFYFTREVWVPSLADTIPKLNPLGLVDSAAKVTDLLALIIQNFKS
jgi:hypothetical protein